MALVIAAAFALLTSFWCCGATIRAARRLQLGVDESNGIQKMHSHWVPRLGGIPIFIAYVAGLLLLAWESSAYERETAFLIVCLLPAFGIGLIEDVTRKAGVLTRLVFTMIAAALGWWLLQGGLSRLDLPLIDTWLAASVPFAFCLTLVAAAGLAHATNIIDGCNGLSSFVSALVLGALGLVALWVGDDFVMRIAWLAAAALLGFFVWNFPFGRIFLGDAGAYTVGFVIAEVSMLLVTRNPDVSPWFPMLLMAYPVWETLFSMYRRARGGSLSQMGQPDALHLHQLIYRRAVRLFAGSDRPVHRVLRNSTASTYLWILATLCVVPALMFWDTPGALQAFCVLFIVTYGGLYRAIVTFRTPRLLVLASRRRASEPSADATSPLSDSDGPASA